MTRFLFPAAATFACLLAACTPGPTGPRGPKGKPGAVSLVRVSQVPQGAECPAGGTRVESGVDTDGDGTLADAEVEHRTSVCNGVDGAPGPEGPLGPPGAWEIVAGDGTRIGEVVGLGRLVYNETIDGYLWVETRDRDLYVTWPPGPKLWFGTDCITSGTGAVGMDPTELNRTLLVEDLYLPMTNSTVPRLMAIDLVRPTDPSHTGYRYWKDDPEGPCNVDHSHADKPVRTVATTMYDIDVIPGSVYDSATGRLYFPGPIRLRRVGSTP